MTDRTDTAPPVQPSDAAAALRLEVEQLAQLDVAGYAVQRTAVADKHHIRVAELDHMVGLARPRHQIEIEPLAAPAPQPCSEPVDLADLLDRLAKFIRRFVQLSDHSITALVLWAVWVYCFSVAIVSPRLRLKSPVKRCGKTTTIEALTLLIPHSISAASVSPSALFRTIDLEHCPIFLDEADTYLSDKTGKDDGKDLRCLLNSGHTQASAYVIRSVPTADGGWQPKRFSTWSPFLIAGIGKVHETLEDRSICVTLQRKPRGTRLESLDQRRNSGAFDDAAQLATQLARFARDYAQKVGETISDDIPEELNDRAVQNWDLLFAIADLGGESWKKRSREAAKALSGDARADDEGLAIRLLGDIRLLFIARDEAKAKFSPSEKKDAHKFPSSIIIDWLCAIVDGPWLQFGRKRQKAITARQLARLLAPFEIYPHDLRMEGRSSPLKGYERDDFKAAFDSYLPSLPENDDSIRDTATNQQPVGESHDSRSATNDTGRGSENGTFSFSQKGYRAVADRNGHFSEDARQNAKTGRPGVGVVTEDEDR